MITDRDVDELLNKKKSTRSILQSDSQSRRGEGIGEFEDSEIRDQYDNPTTQNLCDLMSQANKSKNLNLSLLKFNSVRIELSYFGELLRENVSYLNFEGIRKYAFESFR